MKINPKHTLRTIAGETIIVNQGSTHTDMTRIISLNASARMLWEALAGKEFAIADVAALLVQKYGIAQEQALTDATHWVERLKLCGGIVED